MEEEKDPMEFIGYGDPEELYEIYRITTPTWKGDIVFSLEGNWIDGDCKKNHPDYNSYEELQSDLGSGLEFKGKEYVNIINRTLFRFSRENEKFTLVIPTGGEFYHIHMEILDFRVNILNIIWSGCFFG